MPACYNAIREVLTCATISTRMGVWNLVSRFARPSRGNGEVISHRYAIAGGFCIASTSGEYNSTSSVGQFKVMCHAYCFIICSRLIVLFGGDECVWWFSFVIMYHTRSSVSTLRCIGVFILFLAVYLTSAPDVRSNIYYGCVSRCRSGYSRVCEPHLDGNNRRLSNNNILPWSQWMSSLCT